MATNRDLLKEAIADAKAVKETAIANAKAALTESFTPFLREKLSAKIQEMDEEDENNEEMDETMMEKAEMENEGLDEISLDELLAELEENDSKEMENESKMEDENLYEAKEEEEEEMSIEDMDEDDLKSFIEDVIKDMVAAGELEAGHEGMENEEGAEEEGEEEMESPEEEEEVDIEELLSEVEEGESEEELEEGIWSKIKGTASGIAKAANMFKQPADFVKEMEAALKEDPKLKDDQEFMTTYNFLKGLAVASKAGANTNINKPMEESAELEEAMSTIKTLQSELNEINLLNAKLLYTNKIFRSKSLTESQKVKVLTAFDKATTKKEAQLVYETLQEGLKVSTIKTPIKESLSSASKVLGNASAKPIIENDAFARMRELAGIKK